RRSSVGARSGHGAHVPLSGDVSEVHGRGSGARRSGRGRGHARRVDGSIVLLGARGEDSSAQAKCDAGEAWKLGHWTPRFRLRTAYPRPGAERSERTGNSDSRQGRMPGRIDVWSDRTFTTVLVVPDVPQ